MHAARPAPLEHVSKRFGAVQALTEVDFEVSAGEVVALVGDNGAGKSTLIKVISGIFKADSGRFEFDGRSGRSTSPERRHRPRDRHRVPGPRAVRQPRRRRQPVPRPRAERAAARLLDETDMEQRRARACCAALAVSIPSVRTPGRVAVGRPAPVGRGRRRTMGEPEAGDPRRADRRARRAPDPAGAGPDPPAARAAGSAWSSSATTWSTSSRSPTASSCCASVAGSRPSTRPTSNADQVVAAMTGADVAEVGGVRRGEACSSRRRPEAPA